MVHKMQFNLVFESNLYLKVKGKNKKVVSSHFTVEGGGGGGGGGGIVIVVPHFVY